MDTYNTSDTHGGVEVGIGIARHVYGPASVHLLPCKIHHTGPAPVATYFRPRPPLVEDEKRNNSNNGDSDTAAAATAAAATTTGISLAEATGKGVEERIGEETNTGSSLGGASSGAGENAKPVAADRRENGEGEGDREAAACDQKWELFEDDSAEHTARFRGRKFVGRKVELPEGVHGVVLREQPCPAEVRENNENVTSYWEAETSFREVMVWGHDQPRRESTLDRCLAWLEVSKSIHDP